MVSLFDISHLDIKGLLKSTISHMSFHQVQNSHHPTIKSFSQPMSNSFLWNMSQSINRLPLDIFFCIAELVPGEDDKDAQSIFQLTCVCKYWHESLNLAPFNWTRITNDRQNLTVQSLKQSKEAPLKIWFHMERKQPWFLDLIQPHIKRAVFLEVVLTSFKDLAAIFPHFSESVPNLHSLNIVYYLGQYQEVQIEDPFESLPPLKHLFLSEIPLYQSFQGIKTLTRFILHSYKGTFSLDVLLAFLERNEALNHVDLYINLLVPSSSNRRNPISNQLQYLSLTSIDVEHIKTLIPYLPLERGGGLQIICNDNINPKLGGILPHIRRMYSANLSSPTHIHCSLGSDIILSGPNGSFQFEGPDGSEQNFMELSLSSFEHIQQASFQLFGPALPNFLLFPALEALVIQLDKKTPDTFFASLPSPEICPLLKKLTLRLFSYPKDIMEQLKQYASKHMEILSAKLDQIVLICWNKNYFPSPDLVGALKNYVSEVKLEVFDWKTMPKAVP